MQPNVVKKSKKKNEMEKNNNKKDIKSFQNKQTHTHAKHRIK